MTIESVSRRSPKPGEGVAAPRHGRQRQPATRPQPQPGRGVPVGGGDGGGQGAPRPQPVPGRVGLPGAVLPKAPGKTPGPVVPNVPDGGGTGTGANTATPRPTRPERTERPERSEQRGGGADRSLYDGGSPSANRLGPAKAMRARDVSRP